MRPSIQTMIEDCEVCKADLSDWEKSFITSIREQLSRPNHRGLSDAQLKSLERIWDAKT